MTISNYYPIVVDSSKQVDIVLSPEAKLKKRVIYGITDDCHKLIYVGKTGQALARRVSWYKSAINRAIVDPEHPIGQRKLIQVLKDQRCKYFFTILGQAGHGESLSELEEQFIEKAGKENPLLNANRGGGGGGAKESPSRGVKRKASQVEPELFTPEKNYRVEVKKSKVAAVLTPSCRKAAGIIYRIRQLSTNKVYIGKTESTFSKRLSAHIYNVNAPDEKIARSAFHKLLRDQPDDFDVGVLYRCASDEDIDHAEDLFIQHYKGKNQALNERAGGGGSHGGQVKTKLTFL